MCVCKCVCVCVFARLCMDRCMGVLVGMVGVIAVCIYVLGRICECGGEGSWSSCSWLCRCGYKCVRWVCMRVSREIVLKCE